MTTLCSCPDKPPAPQDIMYCILHRCEVQSVPITMTLSEYRLASKVSRKKLLGTFHFTSALMASRYQCLVLILDTGAG